MTTPIDDDQKRATDALAKAFRDISPERWVNTYVALKTVQGTLADLPPMDDYLARIWIERLGRNLATFADDLHAVSLLLSMEAARQAEAEHKQAKQRKASKRIVSGKRKQ